MYTIILEMKKENDIERPLKGPDKDFRKMVTTGLGLIAGVSLAISCTVSIIILLVLYISSLI
jgi:hypothetical protein